ncbi:PIN domain-containing protein [Leucobacter triazinivorans]|uniref:PIN domain-containing protein n=1 Tax=Leucobacter triazinivorans TaxID=1784719 RepID=A0A4P6KDK7_9MICO|nr:PIN domain-containing protein [Leucobacter triazinivorans]QBE48397.1 PIN domain-containing protein [Leucobacter triazinivorans]
MSSQDSLTEAMYHFRKRKPLVDGDVVSRKRLLIEESLNDIIDSFKGDVDFPGTDEHDRHVHAAAVGCQAKYLLTDDNGFGDIEPDELPYEVHTADSFFSLIAENAPSLIDAVIVRQVKYFTERGSRLTLVEGLTAAGCSTFATCVQQHVERMALGESTHDIATRLTPAASH